jgi:hypothetical protein
MSNLYIPLHSLRHTEQVLDVTETGLSDWVVAQAEVGRKAHILGCGGKDV